MSELRDRIEGLIVDVLRDDLSPREAAGDILALPEIREALAGTGLLAVAEESRRVLIGQIKTAAEKIERLEGDLASARETWGAMLRERDEARAALAAAQEEINHWRVKAKCYGGMVRGCSPALAAAGFPVDASGPDGGVGGVRRSVEGLTSALAAAQAREAKYERVVEALLGAAKGVIDNAADVRDGIARGALGNHYNCGCSLCWLLSAEADLRTALAAVDAARGKR